MKCVAKDCGLHLWSAIMQGSQLSVLRRQVTFQTAHENCSPNIAAPLSLSIFQEMPDPNALINVSSTVALLPSECGNPTDPFAGASDVQVSMTDPPHMVYCCPVL